MRDPVYNRDIRDFWKIIKYPLVFGIGYASCLMFNNSVKEEAKNLFKASESQNITQSYPKKDTTSVLKEELKRKQTDSIDFAIEEELKTKDETNNINKKPKQIIQPKQVVTIDEISNESKKTIIAENIIVKKDSYTTKDYENWVRAYDEIGAKPLIINLKVTASKMNAEEKKWYDFLKQGVVRTSKIHCDSAKTFMNLIHDSFESVFFTNVRYGMDDYIRSAKTSWSYDALRTKPCKDSFKGYISKSKTGKITKN